MRFGTDSMTADLLKAAMRACDAWGDDEPAREAMRAQCLEVPFHLRGDLLAYFAAAYPAHAGGGDRKSGGKSPATARARKFPHRQNGTGG